MKRLPAALLLCVSLLYGQDGPTPSWLSNNRALPLRGPQPTNTAPQASAEAEAPYIEEYPGYDALETYLADTNQYIDPSIFSFTNSGSLGDVPLLPTMPPLLTNGSAQDIIDFIKDNMQIMEGQTQSNKGYNFKPKPQGERAFLDGRPEYELPKAAEGLWWRFYSQNTSIFNIPAAVEEMLVVAPATGEAVWMQTIQTAGSVQSRSQRRLQIAVYQMNAGPRNTAVPLWFFYYPGNVYSANPNPDAAEAESQAKKIQNFPVTNLRNVNETPAYFVQVFPEQGFMQMSKNPTFPSDQTMFWRRFPREVPNILAPPAKTNEAIPLPKVPEPTNQVILPEEYQEVLEGDTP